MGKRWYGQLKGGKMKLYQGILVVICIVSGIGLLFCGGMVIYCTFAYSADFNNPIHGWMLRVLPCYCGVMISSIIIGMCPK